MSSVKQNICPHGKQIPVGIATVADCEDCRRELADEYADARAEEIGYVAYGIPEDLDGRIGN
jgi:hypothetical protein